MRTFAGLDASEQRERPAPALYERFLTGEVNNSGNEILFAAVTLRRAAQAGACARAGRARARVTSHESGISNHGESNDYSNE